MLRRMPWWPVKYTIKSWPNLTTKRDSQIVTYCMFVTMLPATRFESIPTSNSLCYPPMPLMGHHHAMISLICMSTHKATASRCLSYHQVAYGQPAIRALATAPLRRLFTIVTNSYQTTCTVSKRTFNKRQHANARQGVDFITLTHYDMVAAQT